MKRKILLTAVALLCAVASWADGYATTDLTNAGWTKVTSSSITDVDNNFYVLVDANSSGFVMSCDASHFRPCYKTIDDPVANPSFVWILDGENNTFSLQSVATGAFFKQVSGWNTSMGYARDEGRQVVTALFALSDGKYTLKCTQTDQLIGHWNDDGAAVKEDGENIAANKAAANAPGFYLYSIPREQFISSLVSSRKTSASTATKESPLDVTAWIQNADWSGDWGGWESTITSSGNMQWGQETFESWNASNVILKQDIIVPHGLYKFTGDVISGPGATKAAYLYATGDTKVSSSVVSAEASADNYTTMSNEVAGKTLTADNVLVSGNSITVGLDQSTGWIVADNFKLYYYGNSVAVYSHTSFTSNSSATADKWYAFTVGSTGVYKITSSSTTKISYTQDDSDDAEDVSTVDVTAGTPVIMELSYGTFYFKSSVASTITIAALTDGEDLTFMLNNAAVASTTGWANGRTSTGQQYTDAPDNTYMDTWNGTRDQNQSVSLPAGYYLLKVATRADASLSNGYVYASVNSANIGSADIHKEGSTGNLLGNGWAWTRFGFQAAESASVQIGFYSECGGGKWAGADDFHLYYYATELAMKQAQLAQVVADANAWAEKLTTTTALESALSASAPSCSTVEECNTAISNLTTTIANARAAEAPYVEFNRLKAGANSIKDVEYTESGDGAYATFTAVIPAQTTVADNATTAAAVNTAISTLKSAIKTYINNAEPKNDGEFFDVTCLMANPDFSTGDATGWTYANAPNVNWSNCEYYQTEFDIYQTVTGLPTGSYSLNVQAYQRPGEAGTVYNDYIGGTDNATSVLYINSITSKVKNIAADAQTTQKLGDGNFDWPNDSRVGTEGSYRYLPNSQQGAKLYFDAGLYDATCAAVITDVDEGSLKLGFKSTQTHVDYDWTIFDNFRLRYYGSSLLIYYKQYLPQLKDEAQADLDNATYIFVQGKERPDLTTAIAATPAAETEIAYKAVIDDILEKQAAFQSAKSSYEDLNAAKEYAALTEITTNIGDGVFKYPSNTPTLWSTYSSAKSAVDDYTVSNISTAEEVQNMVDALDDAIEAYENITWTTPSSTTRYKLTLAGKGTLTYQTADTDGGYGMPFTPAADYKAQTFFLTPTSGESNYIMSFVDFDGNTRYICDGLASGYTAGTGHYGIRTTTIAEDALSIHIELSTTDDVLYMFNTNVIVDENWKKLGSNGGDFYTDDTYSNWSITEASQASVELSIGAGKLATRIFPFTPTLPEGVEVYTCDATKSETYLALVKEDSPAANIPYILYSENAVESTNITGWGTATTDSYTAGYLTGVLKRTEVPAGSYVLQTQNSKQAFYKVAQAGAYSSPYRVYVTVDSQVKMFNFTLEDIETAIEAARAEGENTVILRYNVAGQQMQNAQKGLNIIKMSDGSVRKVLVK